MSAAPQKYTGWAPSAENKDGHIHLVKTEFEPKAWDEDDIEGMSPSLSSSAQNTDLHPPSVKIKYCGICGTDSHILEEGWGPIDRKLTYVCGHELVGEVVRVGSAVKDRKVGDNVGVGYQSDSCGECDFCTSGKSNSVFMQGIRLTRSSGKEQHCDKMIATLAGVGNKPYFRGNAGKAGSLPKGGFANYWRGPARFAIPIPKEMDLAGAAPMFCGGITMFAPLERMGAGTTRKRVGILGIGGLGHYGILFAKAMGAEVTAISRSRDKEEDAKKLGADHYIAMSEGADDHKNTLDLILCTICT
jgi:alcohol dehydrogenase (NADP+)